MSRHGQPTPIKNQTVGSQSIETEKEREKDGGIFRPCLIGGKFGKYPTLPDYHNPIRVGDTLTSLDMVRVNLRFMPGLGERLDGVAPVLPCDDGGYTSYFARVRPGGWRDLHRFEFGDAAVALGVGHVSKGCKVDMSKGFVEFNPNKLGTNLLFRRFVNRLGGYVKRAEVSRYDLAHDLPLDRWDLRLQKDGRKFKQELSKALTEYLGVRNSAGYVKLYDKAAEQQIEGDLTRIELTCAGDWDVKTIGKHWPTVYGVDVNGEVKGMTKVVVKMMAEKIARGESVEDYLKELDNKTRKRVREVLQRKRVVEFPEFGASQVLLQAGDWALACQGARILDVEG